jgi:ATP-dependent DNA ligase
VQFPVPLAIASSRVQLPTGSYAFESKYDGWRLVAHSDRAQVHMRAGTDVTTRFPEVAAAVAALGDIVPVFEFRSASTSALGCSRLGCAG